MAEPTKLQLEQTFKSELLSPLFNKLMTRLARAAKKKHKDLNKLPDAKSFVVTVAISYAFPIRGEEFFKERMFKLADDLQKVNVRVLMDIITGDISTNFEKETLAWIEVSDFALLIGSASYKERASDPSTLTFHEANALAAKKASNPEGVIPALLAGSFGVAYPPGYTDVMGCDLRDPVQYTLTLPTLVAKLLGIHNHEVQEWLKEYENATTQLLRQAAPPNMQRVKELHAQNARFWSARVKIATSKFTHHQLSILDGLIPLRNAKINDYCTKLVESIGFITVPQDRTLGSVSLEQRLSDFLDDPTRVLLLEAPQGAGKSHTCKYLAAKAWEKKWIPVMITLDPSNPVPVYERLVEDTLSAYQLDAPTIQQAREHRQFLIVVEGFDKCGIQTNAYVRYKFQTWPGKTVFTCRTEYLAKAPYPSFYFMPSSSGTDRADSFGLAHICFTSQYTSNSVNLLPPASTGGSSKSGNNADQHTRQQQNTVQPKRSSAALKELWGKALKEIRARKTRFQSLVHRYSKFNREEHAKLQLQGFLLLQQDVVSVVMQRFLAEISNMVVDSHSTKGSTEQTGILEDSPNFLRMAFISYAWPPVGPERTHLQSRLIQLVKDLRHSSIDVILDILRLRVGVSVTDFMLRGVLDSQAILWIGTPGLKTRISFKDNGDPANPATEEFVHIKNKAESTQKLFLHPLWFVGDTEAGAYPKHTLKVEVTDFRNEREYFHILPLLAAKILEVDGTPTFGEKYRHYLTEIREIEANFTSEAISKRLEQHRQEGNLQQTRVEAQLQQLLDDMPEQYVSQQAAAHEVQLKSLNDRVRQVRDQMLSPDAPFAQALSLYIPLKGGIRPETQEVDRFDVAEKVKRFISDDSDKRVLLIQGGAGSGKSLYGRLIERQCWQDASTVSNVEDSKGATSIIPVFVTLAHMQDPFNNLAEKALGALGFSAAEILLIKATKRAIFILDGLDELTVDKIPLSGVIASNHLLEYPHSKVIFTSRIDFMSTIEKKFHCPYRDHLTQKETGIEEFYLMPFDNAQIKQYIEQFAPTKDAHWNNSNRYMKVLNSISGLKELARNPFVLKLTLLVIPRLTSLHTGEQVTKSTVYKEFTNQVFEQELWKEVTRGDVMLQEDRPARFGELAERLSQELLYRSTTRAVLSLTGEDTTLLRGVPLQQFGDGSFSFIHKSLQDFFAARGWLQALGTGNADRIQSLLGVKLVTAETGLIEFVCESFHASSHFMPLFLQLLASRQTSLSALKVASANAITLLAAAGCSLSGQDLSYVSANGANLDGIIAEGTIFSHADLSGASMRQAWLRDADLREADMAGVEFGVYPFIKIQRYSEIKIFDSGVMIQDLDKATLYHLETGQVLKEFSVPIRIWKSDSKFLHWFLEGEEMVILCELKCTPGLHIWRESRPHHVPVWTNLTNVVGYFNGMVVTSNNSGTYVRELATNRVIVRIPHSVHRIAGNDTKLVVCTDNELEVWDLLTGSKLHATQASCAYFNMYGDKVIYTTFLGDKLMIWDTFSGAQTATNPVISDVSKMAIHEGLLLAGTNRGNVCVWDLDTNQHLGYIFGHLSQHVEAIACKNRKIYVASSGKVTVSDIPTRIITNKPPQNIISVRKGMFASIEDTVVHIWKQEQYDSFSLAKTIKARYVFGKVSEELTRPREEDVLVFSITDSGELGDVKKNNEGKKEDEDGETDLWYMSKIYNMALHDDFVLVIGKTKVANIIDLATGKRECLDLKAETSAFADSGYQHAVSSAGGSTAEIHIDHLEISSALLSLITECGDNFDQIAQVWDLASKNLLFEKRIPVRFRVGSPPPTQRFLFTKIHGTKVIFIAQDGTGLSWDATTDQEERFCLQHSHGGSVCHIASFGNDLLVSHDKAYQVEKIAVGGKPETLQFFAQKCVQLGEYIAYVGISHKVVGVYHPQSSTTICNAHFVKGVATLGVLDDNHLVTLSASVAQSWKFDRDRQTLQLIFSIPKYWELETSGLLAGAKGLSDDQRLLLAQHRTTDATDDAEDPLEGITCLSNHLLSKTNRRCTCDVCRANVTQAMTCLSCDYDMCFMCAWASKTDSEETRHPELGLGLIRAAAAEDLERLLKRAKGLM